MKRVDLHSGVQLDLADPLRDLVLVVAGPDVHFALPAAAVRRCATLEEVDVAAPGDAADRAGASGLGDVLVAGEPRPLSVLPELLPSATEFEVAVLLCDAGGTQPGELIALGPVVGVERLASLQVSAPAEEDGSQPAFAALCRGVLENRDGPGPPLWLLDPERLMGALLALREQAA